MKNWAQMSRKDYGLEVEVGAGQDVLFMVPDECGTTDLFGVLTEDTADDAALF